MKETGNELILMLNGYVQKIQPVTGKGRNEVIMLGVHPI